MVAEPLYSLFSPSRSAGRKRGLEHPLHLGDHILVVWLDSLSGTATCQSSITHTAKRDSLEWMNKTLPLFPIFMSSQERDSGTVTFLQTM